VEDSLGSRVNVLPCDGLASAVRLPVDGDVAMTVLANGCSRWLATRLYGFDQAKPTQLSRTFVDTSGLLDVYANRMVVRFDTRAHHPIWREAALNQECPPMPWWHNLPVAFEYP
jgi:hypothetical protein